MRIFERIFQVTVFVVAGFMVWGGGFFWRDRPADNFTRTNIYTLYRGLPPAPVGPRFCEMAEMNDYGLVGPCNKVPPFVWWLEKRQREKRYDITL
jgi:hypothetical protein